MKVIIKLTLSAFLICCMSCEKYLDLKPDKSLVIPVSLKDCQFLLNNAGILGTGFPVEGEISSTDYYLTPSIYSSMVRQHREPYLWNPEGQVYFSVWSAPYQKILVANQILAVLDNLKPKSEEQKEWNQIKGSALLLRSTTFFCLASLFTQPYDPATANTDLGIPLKLAPSISENINRGTLQQTYDRIIQDFSEAIELLPAQAPINPAMRSTALPVKAAAYAALARVQLAMGNYLKAHEYADASLQQYDRLLNFKDIDSSQYFSFTRYNTEVLYETSGPYYVPGTQGLVSPELYQLYSAGDLRKTLYFRPVGDGTYKFKGGYAPGNIFSGYATNETYLIRAECAARLGNVTAALMDLNAVRQKRYDETYTPLTTGDALAALKLVLQERRKELPFTTLRWLDLRRLNKEPQFAVTLNRIMNGEVYTLPPNDLRYTLLIPTEVLQRTDLPQNPR